MSESGRTKTAEIASGSNTTVKSTMGSLYGAHVFAPVQGAAVRFENGELGASPDLNATGASTIIRATSIASNADTYLDFSPGVGFGKLTVAATSNARVVVVYE